MDSVPSQNALLFTWWSAADLFLVALLLLPDIWPQRHWPPKKGSSNSKGPSTRSKASGPRSISSASEKDAKRRQKANYFAKAQKRAETSGEAATPDNKNTWPNLEEFIPQIHQTDQFELSRYCDWQSGALCICTLPGLQGYLPEQSITSRGPPLTTGSPMPRHLHSCGGAPPGGRPKA